MLAGVAVPLCDYRGHVVQGRHVYRLWTNRHDVALLPPGEPLHPAVVGHGGDGSVELHVEFDAYTGTVSSGPSAAMWELAESSLPLTWDVMHSLTSRRVVLPSPLSNFYLADAATEPLVLSALPPEWRRFNRYALIAAADPVVARFSSQHSVLKKDKHPQLGKTGWMEKIGKSSASKWRRRWFVLNSSEGTLSYYQSNRDSEPRGVIDLQGVTVAVCREHDRSFQRIVGSTRKDYSWYAFKVGRPGERQYIMSCTVKQEVMDWVDAISTVAVTIPPSRKSSDKKQSFLSRLWSRVSTTSPTQKDRGSDKVSASPDGEASASVVNPMLGSGPGARMRRKSHYVSARRAKNASSCVQWGTNHVTVSGTDPSTGERSATSYFNGSTVLWMYALEGLATTDRQSLPLNELKDVPVDDASVAALIASHSSSLSSPSRLQSPAALTLNTSAVVSAPSPLASPRSSDVSPAFLTVTNDPLVLAAFATYLDRCYAKSPDVGVTASDLLFWTECEALHRRFSRDSSSIAQSKDAFDAVYSVMVRYLIASSHVRRSAPSPGSHTRLGSSAASAGGVDVVRAPPPPPPVSVRNLLSPTAARQGVCAAALL